MFTFGFVGFVYMHFNLLFTMDSVYVCIYQLTLNDIIYTIISAPFMMPDAQRLCYSTVYLFSLDSECWNIIGIAA